MTLSRLKWSNGRAAAVAGLLALCGLWALGSLRRDLVPGGAEETLPPLARQVVPLAMLSVVAAWLAVRREAGWPHGRQLRDAVLVGLGLFVVPAGLVELARGWVSDLTRVALFSLALALAVVLEPYLGRSSGEARGGLPAALAAVAGTLLVFPLELPRSVDAACALGAVLLAVASVVAANCRAVVLVTEPRGSPVTPVTAVASAVAAGGLAAMSALTEHATWSLTTWASELLWGATVELPGLVLLFWLMQRMSAVRMMTRFVLAPLIAIVAEMAFARPGVGLRGWLGLLLMGGGAGWLLLAGEDGPEEDGLLLKLDR
jgi:drug/metabolite transporter (DMT)-like permease